MVIKQGMPDAAERVAQYNPKTIGRNMTFSDFVSVFTWEDEEKTRKKEEAQKAEDAADHKLRLEGYFKDVTRGDTDWTKSELLIHKDPEAKTATLVVTADGKELWNKKAKNLYDKDPEGYNADDYVLSIGTGNQRGDGVKPYPGGGHNTGAHFGYSMDDEEGGTKEKHAYFLGLEEDSGVGSAIYGFLHPLMF
eukprot:Hpha_TRINITY_DN9145_c0_g1::TRINITY_DN9145_c0_g1_i2::g.94282::m.94282